MIRDPLLLPHALPPVPEIYGADRWDNIIREWGIGYCCEWFGHGYDGEFSIETLRVLQERNAKVSP